MVLGDPPRRTGPSRRVPARLIAEETMEIRSPPLGGPIPIPSRGPDSQGTVARKAVKAAIPAFGFPNDKGATPLDATP